MNGNYLSLEEMVFKEADLMRNDPLNRFAAWKKFGLAEGEQPTEAQLAQNWYESGAASRFAAEHGYGPSPEAA
jgi:hypothetical protein